MRGLISLVGRFRDDERGVFAVLFGLFAVVLIAMGGAVVDFTNIELTRTRAQQALDSAALGLAPKMYSKTITKQNLIDQAEALVVERVNNSEVTIEITDATIDKPNGTIRFFGEVTVPMAFVQLIGIQTLRAKISSEATKGSTNIEVAVALDNTGSMDDDIPFLQEGLNGIIDIVVNDVQEPTYSKMALAPYAAQVYAGAYAPELRGTIPDARPMTRMYWSGDLLDLTAATKANPVKVTTAAAHGYSNGDIVYISGVSGMTQLNSKFYKVANKTSTTFELQTTSGSNVNGTSYGTFSTSNVNDKVRKCLSWDSDSSKCQVYVEALSHGFLTGDYIRTDGNSSSSTYRNKTFSITKVDGNTFALDGQFSNSATFPLATNGGAWCTQYGCEWYRFNNSNGGTSLWRVSNCVTERVTDAYTDAAPTTTWLGLSYVNSSGTCDLDQAITPLTADKDILHAQADAMTDHGNTAGHLGTAWAWYLLAPNFGSVWDATENVPASYSAPNTIKVAILMTDGQYNQQYCNGVASGSIADCEQPNDSTTQARALCTAMKAAGVVVYTVGFRISSNSSQATTMTNCASDASKAFRPANGTELVADFEEIGQRITNLRLSK
jgi:Flp pilus assembly protein TadG